MKYRSALIIVLFLALHGEAQPVQEETTSQLEELAAAGLSLNLEEEETKVPEQFRKHPINLNAADAIALRELKILSELQVSALISYRQLFGPLANIYELQAVPAWDINTIRQILPYVSIANPVSMAKETQRRFRHGEHLLLLRCVQDFGKEKDEAENYKGSPQQVLFRYRYNYKGVLQYGITGEKDAGEQFFQGAQRYGFDFYSVHFFTRNLGRLRSLALGDYMVNIGQGLVLWQGIAFRKSAETMNIRRQSEILRPYNSAGEYYFNRGVALTLQAGKLAFTNFASLRSLSANTTTDSLSQIKYISSLLTSGYNRSNYEIADRHAVKQMMTGMVIAYKGRRLQVGLNGVYSHYTLPVRKRDEPYNLFAWKGKAWYNASMDYSCTIRNFHFFGEAAMDKQKHPALVNGMLINLSATADIALLHRMISPAYQSVSGNAFTENTAPVNERGLYAGIDLHPAAGWRVAAYADISAFPWLKYNTNAPSGATDFLVQVTRTLSRQVELYTRYRIRKGQGNTSSANDNPVPYPVISNQQNWRTQVSWHMNPNILFRMRTETVTCFKEGGKKQNGFSGFLDIVYKPMLSPIAATMRLQYVETEGYDTRVYAYENDVLYSYSIPAYAGRSCMYYLLLSRDIGKHLSCWLRVAQLFPLPEPSAVSDGNPNLLHIQTRVSLQTRLLF